MKTWLLSAGFVLLVACICSQAPAQPTDDGNWDRYEVVFERSVFSRNRVRKAAPSRVEQEPTVAEVDAEPAPPPPPAEPPHPATHFVLIGISRVDGQGTAIFEDRRDGSIHDVTAGDELGGLRIESIGELVVSTTYESEPVKVELGRTLTGQSPPPVVQRSAAGAESATSEDGAPSGSEGAADAPPGGGDESVDPATLSIIERMRLRRQQELGR